MLNIRVIPILLLKNKGLVKGINFKNHMYVGDPINAVKIFNDKYVHELMLMSITGEKIPIDIVMDIADECYMPFGIGGGIKTIEDIKLMLNNGAEKVCINTEAVKNPLLIKKASEIFGSQSIIVSIDVKKKFLGKEEVFINSGKTKTGLCPLEHAIKMQKMGAGEIIINSIDKEGKMQGYDIELINKISNALSIPVIASGGAGKFEHLQDAIKNGASAVSAGSMFVYYGVNRAVLINYLNEKEIEKLNLISNNELI